MNNKNFIFLAEVESTNNYANQLILSKAAEEGTVVLAQFQTKGRGQKGNSWESEAGKNLLASIILLPRFLSPGKQFLLSKAASLALVNFLNTETDDVSIKWPNDIYIGNKKVAGLLIENSVKGNFLDTSIIGIGLNLNQVKFNSDAPNPVSLKQITGKEYNIEKVAKQVKNNFDKWYKKLIMSDFEETDKLYLDSLFRINKRSSFLKDGKAFEAKITGIGEFGQLILTDPDGKKSEYHFKEIEFVI